MKNHKKNHYFPEKRYIYIESLFFKQYLFTYHNVGDENEN